MPKESIYSPYNKKGSFTHFLTQTNEKEITLKHLLKKLEEQLSLTQEESYTFTDLGAGDGTLTFPIINFLRERRRNLEVYCVEPSDLMKILKNRCGSKVNYLKAGMEDIDLPKSDLILMAHSINHLTDKESFAQKIKSSLKPNGLLLVVGTKSDCPEHNFRKELSPKSEDKKVKSKHINFFDFFQRPDYLVNTDFEDARIDLTSVLKPTKIGKAIIDFYYGKPFDYLSKDELKRFYELARKYAPDNKLIKTLRFVQVRRL